ncbi:MAG: carbon-nitrogen hydrolase family protein [Chromatiaceae bacterium]
MSRKPRVAAIQMASSPHVSANLMEARRLIQEAVDESGANLVVLPENFAFMGEEDRDLLDLCETEGQGPLQDFLAEMAVRYRIWLVGGTLPLTATQPDRVRAACLVFNDRGERVARYDKIHLFDVKLLETGEHYEESATIEPGDTPVVLDTPFGRLGLSVCYDLRFPELYREMLDAGMEIMALPACFTAITGKAHWEVLVRARAIENLCHVVAAAQGGYHRNGRETHGHSMVVDPWGNVLAQVPRGSGHVCCPLDVEFLNSVRRNFPAIEHRRLTCRV